MAAPGRNALQQPCELILCEVQAGRPQQAVDAHQRLHGARQAVGHHGGVEDAQLEGLVGLGALLGLQASVRGPS